MRRVFFQHFNSWLWFYCKDEPIFDEAIAQIAQKIAQNATFFSSPEQSPQPGRRPPRAFFEKPGEIIGVFKPKRPGNLPHLQVCTLQHPNSFQPKPQVNAIKRAAPQRILTNLPQVGHA